MPAALGEGLLRLRRTRVRFPPPPPCALTCFPAGSGHSYLLESCSSGPQRAQKGAQHDSSFRRQPMEARFGTCSSSQRNALKSLRLPPSHSRTWWTASPLMRAVGAPLSLVFQMVSHGSVVPEIWAANGGWSRVTRWGSIPRTVTFTPRPDDRSPDFIVDHTRCWATVYDRNLRSTHRVETPTWTGRWFSPAGDRGWRVWSCPDHLDGLTGLKEFGQRNASRRPVVSSPVRHTGDRTYASRYRSR